MLEESKKMLERTNTPRAYWRYISANGCTKIGERLGCLFDNASDILEHIDNLKNAKVYWTDLPCKNVALTVDVRDFETIKKYMADSLQRDDWDHISDDIEKLTTENV